MKAYITSCTTGRAEWVGFPTTAEDLNEVYARLGGDEFYASDYDAEHVDPYEILGEFVDLEKMNALAELDAMLTGRIASIIEAAAEFDAYDVVSNVVSFEEAEEIGYGIMAAGDGLMRMRSFMAGVSDWQVEYLRIDEYGNLENITTANEKDMIAELAKRAA